MKNKKSNNGSCTVFRDQLFHQEYLKFSPDQIF